MGHSTGGLLAQMLAGRGSRRPRWRSTRDLPRRSAAVGLRAQGGGPFLVNPFTQGRAITLTFDQFKYGWANALGEGARLYDGFHVAGSASI